eukprot:gene8349-8533_t
MDMLELKEFREFKKIILLGYRYAQRLDEAGEFARFDTEDVAKQLQLFAVELITGAAVEYCHAVQGGTCVLSVGAGKAWSGYVLCQ